ncbi:finger putative transcription factor family-related [Holotrichia oblita]|uniref:Finger putative transcription factor family-related n=1 Tax=Holotrichia oblita TaxID=644536 RepID=A0ACB9TIM5_HOLOL|nr:finger putative transcription factor family-related [Holotrichia oblita]
MVGCEDIVKEESTIQPEMNLDGACNTGELHTESRLEKLDDNLALFLQPFPTVATASPVQPLPTVGNGCRNKANHNEVVAVNDGYPINACNECIEKLNSIYDFKTMVMESDIKLHQLFRNKVTERDNRYDHVRNDTSSPSSAIKSELSEAELTNVNNDVNENKPHSYDSLDYANLPIEQDDIHMECSNDDDESISNRPMVGFEDIMKEEPTIQPEINLDGACDTGAVHTESRLEKLDDNEVVSAEVAKTKFKTKVNVNEQQVELLNNADYNKIMSMGLTKKQKNRMTIFCPDCNKSFTFRYFVDVHAHIHTGNLLFKCDKCDKRFPKKIVLTNHMRSHLETRDFKCEECGKAYKTITVLRAHKREHLPDRSLKCHLCTKAFKSSGGLRTHIRTHLNERTHICEICGKSYVDASGLNCHKLQEHDPDRRNRSVSCEICGKVYMNKRGVRNHITRQHNGKRPYDCEKCGKSFFDTTILKQHMFIHTGEKPYACRLCGKKFRQKGCITQHMRIHTGETPHPCKYCTARFKHSHHLNGHIKAHHKDKVEI